MKRMGSTAVLLTLLAGCGDSPFDVVADLPDGSYVVTTRAPLVSNEFLTPAWMYATPRIEFTKTGDRFVVTSGSDDEIVLGPAQLAARESTLWIVRFGWAPLEEHHYWQVEMTSRHCSAAAVDADLGVGETGALVVPLLTCTIARR